MATPSRAKAVDQFNYLGSVLSNDTPAIASPKQTAPLWFLAEPCSPTPATENQDPSPLPSLPRSTAIVQFWGMGIIQEPHSITGKLPPQLPGESNGTTPFLTTTNSCNSQDLRYSTPSVELGWAFHTNGGRSNTKICLLWRAAQSGESR